MYNGGKLAGGNPARGRMDLTFLRQPYLGCL